MPGRGRPRGAYPGIYGAMREIEKNPEYAKMRGYAHHRAYTRTEHCRNVALCAGYLAHKLKFGRKSVEDCVKAEMLHDYFTYDYGKDRRTGYGDHSQAHAVIAAENAAMDFGLNRRQENAILAHMFPTGPWRAPSCKEAWAVNIADKYCAAREILSARFSRKKWRFRL